MSGGFDPIIHQTTRLRLMAVLCQLDEGDWVVTLVVFDGTSGAERLESFPGLPVQVVAQDVNLLEARFPSVLERGTAVSVEVVFQNVGPRGMRVRPVGTFLPEAGGDVIEVEAEAIVIESGETLETTVALPTDLLPAGYYFAGLTLVLPGGRRESGILSPVEVR